jgi:diguanylate cyclase (GGDEF)-like protein
LHRKILIIDDEEAIRDVVKVTLELLSGWTALTAPSGSEGIDLALAELPDAILLDAMMPGTDGPHTLAALQSNPSTQAIPVLFLTAKMTVEDLKKLRTLGAKAVIAKPFDPMTLANEIAQTLGWPEGIPSEAKSVAGAAPETRSRFLSTARERLEVLEEAGTAVLEKGLTLPLRAAAEHEAHKLAGTLGTIGLASGSRFAREIEGLFHGGTAMSEAQSLRASELIVALRLALEEASSSSIEALNSSSNRPNLFIIDAGEELARQLELEAAIGNWNVKWVQDLDAARNAIRGEPPDLILLDPHVSGNSEDGLSFLQEMSGRSPSVPVMALTSQDAFTDRVEVARRGGKGFLSKSLPAGKIVEAASQLLSRLRAEDNRILAVDDDPEVLSFLRRVLETRGLRIETLEHPLQFWERLEATAPDLVLLDVDMPHLSGVELCRIVRNDPRWAEIPILFLTAHNNPETIDRVFSAGADDFVPKPVVGPELLTRVFNRLEQTRLRKSMAETDFLTGALNRGKFSKSLSGFLDLAGRHSQPVAFALLAIDQLKEINDAHSHGTGDAVLQRVGSILRDAFCGADVFGRWSGSRFAVGMYGLARYDAVERLRKLAERVRNAGFKAPGGAELLVTLSAGVAEYDADGDDLERLFKAAESALLKAQKLGGARVLPAWMAARSKEAGEQLDVALVMRDEAQSSLLVHALDGLGCRTRWFRDGNKVINLMAGSQPAISSKVMLLDVELPGNDGLSVLKRLACDGVLAKTRVIVLTAPSVQNDAQAALELGAFDCMVKPFNPPLVVQHIRRALNHAN